MLDFGHAHDQSLTPAPGGSNRPANCGHVTAPSTPPASSRGRKFWSNFFQKIRSRDRISLAMIPDLDTLRSMAPTNVAGSQSGKGQERKNGPGVSTTHWKGSFRTRESKEMQAFFFDCLCPRLAGFCWIWLNLAMAWKAGMAAGRPVGPPRPLPADAGDNVAQRRAAKSRGDEVVVVDRPGVDEGDDAWRERRRQAAHSRYPRGLELRTDRFVALARRGRVGADEEGVAPRPLDPAHELVAFAVERVEQHHAADAALIAADGERIDRREIAAAIGDDDHRHAVERAVRVRIELAELHLRLAEEGGESVRRPEPPGARILRVDRELRRHQHRVEARISELAHDLLAGDDVARQRRRVAMEENDDHARPGGIEGLRRRKEHAAVAVGLVLPMDPSPRRGMAKPAVVVDIEERPGLARLLIVRDQTMIGESRVLERGERDIGAVNRRDAGRKTLAGPDGRRRGRTGAVGREEGRAKRQAHRLRPPEKTTLHGLILNNPLAAPKDLFKAGLQNREDRSSLKASVQRARQLAGLSLRGPRRAPERPARE